MRFDELIECSKCGSDASYVQEVTNDIKIELCYGCGFQSSTAMYSGSALFKEQMETLPDLYKSLMVEEEDGKLWMPSHIHVEGTGSVFANGTGPDNWVWSGVLATEVSEEDKDQYKGAKYKSDMSTIKHFKERDFMEALSYIKVLP